MRIAAATGDAESAAVQTLDFADRVRVAGPIALVVALLLALAAVAVGPSRRDAVFRVGVAVAAGRRAHRAES